MEHGNTNWSQSVTAVVIRDGKVLLARLTYGSGNGKLIVPGGYLDFGESPEAAVKREYLEETGVTIEPKRLIAIRCNEKDWYIAFSAEYVSGEATSDSDENSEVVWMDVDEALVREDVPDLTKQLIRCAMNEDKGFVKIPYKTKSNYGDSTLYGVEIGE